MLHKSPHLETGPATATFTPILGERGDMDPPRALNPQRLAGRTEDLPVGDRPAPWKRRLEEFQLPGPDVPRRTAICLGL